MKYIIEAFDKETEFLNFEVELPDGIDSQIAEIMVWSTPPRGEEGYDLNANQIAAIEELAGRTFYDTNNDFQLTCNID